MRRQHQELETAIAELSQQISMGEDALAEATAAASETD
jgi:hypothetical protein